MATLQLFHCLFICSYTALLTTPIVYAGYTQCYNDINICLWTDGSQLTHNEAKTACQQRNSVLLRVTNSNIQSKLTGFRSAAGSLLSTGGHWIDVTAVGIVAPRWIDGSPLAAGVVIFGASDIWARFAVASYDSINRKFVFSARRYNNKASAYICQLQVATCAARDLSMNSKCYRKFFSGSLRSWFFASNDCLSRGGSLAVFSDIGRPTDNAHLTNWLLDSGTGRTYWIGLVRPWWKTTDKDGNSIDLQYSSWQNHYPRHTDTQRCVLVTHDSSWWTFQCNSQQRYVCQNYRESTHLSPSTTTTTASTTTTTKLNMSPQSPIYTATSTSSTSYVSDSVTTVLSGAGTIGNPSAVEKSNGGNDLAVTIGIVVGVTVGALLIVAIIIITVLVKYRKRRSIDQPTGAKSNAEYATLDTETARDQHPQYDVIQLDQRPHNHNYENTPTSAAPCGYDEPVVPRLPPSANGYETLDIQRQGDVQPQYEVIQRNQPNTARQQTHNYENAATATQR